MPELGGKSLTVLSEVQPQLIAVVKRAIVITTQDFSVVEGIRSPARQNQLVEEGKSHTYNSKHLTGDAVDIYPFDPDERKRAALWSNPVAYFPIIQAMAVAADELGTPITAGMFWARIYKNMDCMEHIHKYLSYCRKTYKSPLIDSPHFELI